ncbi:MAG TPA: tetratricopeptide repeat protein, partial [Roseiflexaceae bacterium]|nr:tetratricopeptide repeat protein [Roseiflexaceae bacterium]
QLRILATSREPLGVAGEAIVGVPALAMPDPQQLPPLEAFAQVEAIQLFVERARAVEPAFQLTPARVAPLIQICRRLDGIALAIELAAARVRMLTLEQLAQRLEDNFRFLTTGSRTALPRHQTLTASIDWSYTLLTDAERALLRRLSVFAGGWTLEAAEAIAGDSPQDEALELLTHLVDKSLVQVDRSGAAARYRMLETIRAYALERLEASGEAHAVRRRHAHFFVAFVEAAEPELTGIRQSEWLDQLGQEHDNVRAALTWSLERGEVEAALRIGAALWGFWGISGHVGAGRRWLEAALARPEDAPPAVRAKALNAVGGLAWTQGDYDSATELIEESLALRRAIGDRGGAAESLLYWGRMARNRGDYERAAALEEQSLALFRELGNQEGIAWALLSLGDVALEQGDAARALPWLQEALAVYRGLGDAESTAWALCNLGRVARVQGDGAQAEALLLEGLTLLRDVRQLWGVAELLIDLGQAVRVQGDGARAEALLLEGLTLLRDLGGRRMVPRCLEGLAEVAAARGRPERATRLFGAAEALRETLGAPLPPVERAPYDDGVNAARAQLDAAAFAAAWAAGRALRLDQAVAYGLEGA